MTQAGAARATSASCLPSLLATSLAAAYFMTPAAVALLGRVPAPAAPAYAKALRSKLMATRTEGREIFRLATPTERRRSFRAQPKAGAERKINAIVGMVTSLAGAAAAACAKWPRLTDDLDRDEFANAVAAKGLPGAGYTQHLGFAIAAAVAPALARPRRCAIAAPRNRSGRTLTQRPG